MKFTIRQLSALAAACVAGGLVAVPAAPAEAAWTDCRSGAFCLFSGTAWNELVYSDSTKPQWDNNLHDASSNFGDKAFSLRNATGAYICIYTDAGYRGESRVINPRDGLQLGGTPFAGEISSYSIVLGPNPNCDRPEPRY